MTTETDLRHAYARVVEDTPPGPDLASVLDRGRGARRRRTRVRALAATGLAAAVAGVAVVVPRLVPEPQAPATPAPATPATQDFVAGTSVDEMLAETVSRHLPTLGTPRDVFPSDSEHNGPMPDADFARAEDWQAEYAVGDGGLFRLMVVHPAAGPAYDCATCEWSPVPGGRSSSEVSRLTAADGSTLWRFLLLFASDSGFEVSVTQDVAATSRSGAEAARTADDAQVLELAQDPQLTFPAPVR